MRILFLTSRVPYPPHRGDKLKIWNLIKQLSVRHEIVLLTFVRNRQEMAWADFLRPLCKDVRTVHLPVWRSLLNCVWAIFKREPFQVEYYRSGRMLALLRQEIEESKPDVIHTHLIRMASYTAGEKQVPRILDMTDAVSLYLSRFRSSKKNPVAKWLLGVELGRMRRFEAVIGQFNLGLVCSDTDRQFLMQEHPDLRLGLLANGVDVGMFTAKGSARPEPGRIIFTGNMSYFPNIDAAAFMVDDVLPRVKKIVPGAKLFIVGQNPTARVRSLAGEDVVVTGFVPDICAEYVRSSVAVSPVRFGAGTLNKVLEPLALGVPVVASSIGLDGLGLENGADILIADGADQFAAAVVRLLTDESLRTSMGLRASEKVRSQFGWGRIAQRLELIYEDVLRSGPLKYSVD